MSAREPSFTRPPRDTGLMLEGRAARERRRKRRAQQRAVMIAALVTFGVIAIGWFLAQTAPKPVEQTAVANGIPSIERAGDMPKEDIGPVSEPTPLFAAYKDVALHVPVPAADLTELAFHQASFTYAQRLVTKLPTYPTDKAKKKRGTGRSAEATPTSDTPGWLGGYVLRLWRSRPGKPDTSADVGAAPGTPVVAPVTGEVLKVKSYFLYGKHPDYQIHIRPEGHTDLDVVLIHISDPRVAVGDQVTGGMSQVGAVRKLSHKIRLQLSDYTRDAGDHTHVQLNRVKPGTTEGVTK